MKVVITLMINVVFMITSAFVFGYTLATDGHINVYSIIAWVMNAIGAIGMGWIMNMEKREAERRLLNE